MPEGKGTYGSKRGRPKKAMATESKKPKPVEKKAKAKPSKSEKKKSDSPFEGLKEGALSKTLGIPVEDNIPKSLLNKLKKAEVGTTMEYKGKKIKVTKLLHKRVNFALNFAK